MVVSDVSVETTAHVCPCHTGGTAADEATSCEWREYADTNILQPEVSDGSISGETDMGESTDEACQNDCENEASCNNAFAFFDNAYT